MRSQPHFTLLWSLRLQSKKRQQRTAANGSQDEGQGRRRKRAVEDSGLEITRMDVEEVSTFKAGMQPSSLVHSKCCLNIWPTPPWEGGVQPSLVSMSVDRALWVWFPTLMDCSPMDCLVHLDSGVSLGQHLSPLVSCWQSWAGWLVCNESCTVELHSWNSAKLILTGRRQAAPKYFSALNYLFPKWGEKECSCPIGRRCDPFSRVGFDVTRWIVPFISNNVYRPW